MKQSANIFNSHKKADASFKATNSVKANASFKAPNSIKAPNSVKAPNSFKANASVINSSAILKKKIRKNFRSRLQKESLLSNKASDGNLSTLLSQLDIWKQNPIMAMYRALPGEISPAGFQKTLQKTLQKKHKNKLNFVFPQVKNQQVKFVFADLDKKEDWQPSPWPKVLQPSGHKGVSLKDIDVFLVPSLALDREGRRLGRGLGFYDKVLAKTSALKIGLVWAFQVSNTPLPEEEHDIRMDMIATERFLLILDNYFLRRIR